MENKPNMMGMIKKGLSSIIGANQYDQTGSYEGEVPNIDKGQTEINFNQSAPNIHLNGNESGQRDHHQPNLYGERQTSNYGNHRYSGNGGFQPQSNQPYGNGNYNGSMQSGQQPASPMDCVSATPGTSAVSPQVKELLENLGSQIALLSEKLDVLMINGQKTGNALQSNVGFSHNIIERLDQLTGLNKLIESQESIIQKQHDAAVKYNEDVIYKTQKSLIMEMIGIADHIHMIIENKREDESYDLMEGLLDLEKSVAASLSNNSVRKFSEAEIDDSILNRKRQTVVGRERTSEEQLDNHFKSVTPGYEWTMPYLVVNSEVKLNKILEENGMPQTFSFVIRPEEVVKLSYRSESPVDQKDDADNL